VYVTPSPTGNSAVLAFTLADRDADTIQAKFARETGAIAYGLLSIVGWPDGPRYPLIWTHDSTQLGIVMADEDEDLGQDLQTVITRYLAVFFKDGSSRIRVGDPRASYRVEHASQDLEAEILLIAQAVGPALEDADLVVEAFNEAEGDLVLGLTEGGDAVPVPFDRRSARRV